MSKRLNSALALALALGLSLSVPALAHPGHGDDEGVLDSGTEVHGHLHGNHGGPDGHLPPSTENVRLVGRMRINQDQTGRVADVGVFGDYAYLGAFFEPRCQKGGVYVFDISDPTKPKQINFIRAANDTYVGEGVHVIRLDTAHFQGELLIHNNEICGPSKHAKGGVSLIDVTNPKTHKYLAEGVGDFGDPPGPRAHQSHSAFGWTQETPAGQRAYVIMVDNEETADVDILDITDPRNPVLIAEYDLNAEFPQIIQPELGTAESFHHDVVVKEIDGRMVALVSYWDGGYVLLDVTDPTAATYIADSDFAFPDPQAAKQGLDVDPEGNAHQAEFSLNSDYIVAADEDFSPFSVIATNTTDGTQFSATQGTDVPQIDDVTSLAGTTVYVGLACNSSAAVPPAGEGTIALVERGDCTFTEKLGNVEAAGGYAGMIVFNREGADGCSSLLTMLVAGNIPALFVGRDVGFDLLNLSYDEADCRAGDGTATATAAIGALGDEVNIEAIFDGWGYVHLFRTGEGKLEELDTFAIPEAHDPAFASGFGDLSVHEVAMSHVRNDLAYLSYYSGGFRVVRITPGETLEEVGHFIGPQGNNFWGVEVWHKDGKEYVLASDRDFGLYIFEYIGPDGPND